VLAAACIAPIDISTLASHVGIYATFHQAKVGIDG
jgi:hypothetical protein